MALIIHSILATLFLYIPSVLEAAQLPAVEAGSFHAAELDHSPDWWAQVDDKVYYTPLSLLGLSQNVSDYYYMMGSESALTPEMKERRVGGTGRWHIMHLPEGASMLQMSHSVLSGDRRAAFSALNRLEHGKVLSSKFPEYQANSDYRYPLSHSWMKIEKKAAAGVHEGAISDYLDGLLAFDTRSYSNTEESDKVEHYLEKEFQKMGYTTCMQNYDYNGKTQTNVIAHIPGSSTSTITVAAHYDSRPFDGKAPGAEDNGSGVATMLAIAKAYAENVKRKPKRNIYFAGFSAEEPGLVGSGRFATSLKNGGLDFGNCKPRSRSFLQKRSTKRTGSFLQTSAMSSDHAAIVLDEVGWLSSKYPQQTVNLESYDSTKPLMDHLRHSSDMHNGNALAVEHNNAPFGSDHMSFLSEDMMGVLTINSDDEAYPHYHQSSDTKENVNAGYMAKIGKMNIGALIRMAHSS